MSKAQKGNKEKEKPKADKNQSKANVSAYKAAQGQGKPASSPFANRAVHMFRTWQVVPRA
jgi:hypothetical protein